MRIAQVAPLNERVPPPLYGGTERVVSYLTEELVQLGHDVTLFASGDSETSARLVAACPRALWRDSDVRETLPHHAEPVGLVMIEALACGTPVIAWRRGSVPEVLENGVTGYIVESVDDAVRAVDGVDRLSQATCRRVFEQRFDARRMATDYLDVYRRVIAAG